MTLYDSLISREGDYFVVPVYVEQKNFNLYVIEFSFSKNNCFGGGVCLDILRLLKKFESIPQFLTSFIMSTVALFSENKF